MNILSQSPESRVLFAVFAVLSLSHASCRKDDSAPAVENQRLAQSLFVPVGVVRTPVGIAVDRSGSVWVSDSRRNVVWRFNPNGVRVDSITTFIGPGRMGFDRLTGNILLVDNSASVVSINPATKATTTVSSLASTAIDGSSVFDLNSGQSSSRTPSVRSVGDVDGAPNGDIFVSVTGAGNDNYLARIRSGGANALLASFATPFDPRDLNSKFVAVDAFGTVYTSFVVGASPTGNPLRLFSVVPGNLLQSQPFGDAPLTGGAQGAGIDDAGILFIADAGAFTPQVVVVSTTSRRLLDVYTMPAIGGMSQPAPTDVAAAADGSVYVSVTDLLATAGNPGAILKFSRQ